MLKYNCCMFWEKSYSKETFLIVKGEVLFLFYVKFN